MIRNQYSRYYYMAKVNKKTFIKYLRHHIRLLILVLAIASIAGTLLMTHASLSTTPLSSLFNSVPTTTAINSNDISLASDWKTFSQQRKTLRYSEKYPSNWEKAYYHCNTQPTEGLLDLAPSCVKTVIFTENIPADDESGNGRKLKLVSKTKAVVQGYTVLRKIYTMSGREDTPDTYQVWFYDKDRPFMLFLAWIGAGTDSDTANAYVHIFDNMVSSIQLQR